MAEITNVRISKDTIVLIAQYLNERHLKMSDLYKQKEEYERQFGYTEDGEVHDLVVTAKPGLTFEIETHNHTETKSDFTWFRTMLYERSREIEKVSIYYSSMYAKNCTYNECYKGMRGEEDVSITFTKDYIYYSNRKENSNLSFDEMIEKIDQLLYYAPKRCDKTVVNKSARKNIPSLSIGLTMGIIFSLVLFILFKFNIIDYGLKDYILSFYTIPIILILSIAVGVSIPGRNHDLYRRLGLKQRYVGYNRSSKTDIYTEDYKNIRSACEVEIGEYSNNGIIRDKIEENYKKARAN